MFIIATITNSFSIEGIDAFLVNISAYPPSARPENFNFPERNKIIAALPDELIVINPGKRSTQQKVERAGELRIHPEIFFLITPYGLVPNSYSGNIQTVITLDDLFK